MGRVSVAYFDPMKHPRNREGKFAAAIASHGYVRLPGDIHVRRNSPGEYAVIHRSKTQTRRGAGAAAALALEISAKSKDSHTLGYRAFRSYAHFQDHERRLRKYFKHQDGSGEWRSRMRSLGHDLAEAKIARIGFKFDTNLHPHDRLGRFRETLDKLPKPKLLGGSQGVVDVHGTGFHVVRTPKGFDVHHESLPTQSFKDASGAAEHVHNHVVAAESAQAAERLAAQQAEHEQRQEAAKRQRLVERGKELDNLYTRDPQGRRIYRHYESDPLKVRQIEDSGELWGQGFGAQRGTFQALNAEEGGEARAYKVKHDGSTRVGAKDDPDLHAVDFVVDEALDPHGIGGRSGAHPAEGAWTMGGADQSAVDAGLIRQEDGFVKIKIQVVDSTLHRQAQQ